MTRKTWSDVEVSAYLDGQLDTSTQTAMEAAISADTELRSRVEDMQRVVSVLREMPLREAPRNFLLTPSMVKEDTAKTPPKRTRRPLLWMRLATTFSAAVFVLTIGVNLLASWGPPIGAVYAPQDMERMMLQKEAPAEEVEMAAAEKSIAVTEVVEESEAEDEKQAMALATAPLGEDAEALGVGGGAEGDAGPLPESEQRNGEMEAPAAPPPEPGMEGEVADEVATDDTAEAEAPAPLMLEQTEAPVEAWEQPQATLRAEPTRRGPVPLWVSVSLGIITVLLAGLTLWINKRQ